MTIRRTNAIHPPMIPHISLSVRPDVRAPVLGVPFVLPVVETAELTVGRVAVENEISLSLTIIHKTEATTVNIRLASLFYYFAQARPCEHQHSVH